MNQRIVYLDGCRVLACCMVVLMHSPAPNAGVPGFIQVPLYFLTSAGLLLFFMVSGALLLPTKGDTFQWLRHRMGKILGPALFWSLFYIALNFFEGNLSEKQLFHDIFSIPFTFKGEPVMWFMYTLAGLYFLSPIISPFIKQASKNELRLYLWLWVVSLLLPLMALLVDVDTSHIGVFYYFSGFVGYFLLGYYLHNYGSRLKLWMLPLCIIVPLLCCYANRVLGGDDAMIEGYLNIFVAIMALAWFEAFRRSSVTKKFWVAFLVEFSKCSFGIYLMHILIMRHILWKIDFVIYGFGWIGQLVMTWVLTLVISFLLTKAISYLPYSEYIIGYHTKNN